PGGCCPGRCRRVRAKSMVGARSRCLNVADSNAPGPSRENAGGHRFEFGLFYGSYRDRLSRPNHKFSRNPSHRSHRCHLHPRLHSAEARYHDQHVGRRDSRRASASDRVGGSSRLARFRSLDFVRDRLRLANPALLRHRLALSSRLRQGRMSYALQRRLNWSSECQSGRSFLHAPSIDRRNSGVYRNDEFDLFVGGNYSGRTFHRGSAAFSSHWERRQRAPPFFVVNNLSAAFVCRINVNQIMTATLVSSNPSTPRKSRAATLALILFPVVIGASMLWLRHVEVQRLASRKIRGYGSIPPFQLINQDGQAFGSSNLAGKIWIADFIYSTCPGPCPMISSRMSEMQKPLEKTDVHFISFTVDPEKDTPAQLREYAGRLRAQPGRWDFLTGPKSEIYKLSQEGFKLAAVDRSSSTPEPLHSTRMILVDRRGQIRGYYDATTADAITKLLADTNHLLKEQPR